jgi:polyferredoxin
MVLFAVSILLVIGTTVLAQEGGQRRAPGFFEIWKTPRIWMSAIFCAIGLLLLMRGLVTKNLRLIFLPIIFFAFSVLAVLPLGYFAQGMGLHPSPVCNVTRPFQFLDAGRSIPILFLSIFASIAVLSVIGNKLFCGWVCPIGAAQELVHRVPMGTGLKKRIPFRVSNPIRIIVFVVFVPVVFLAAVNIYDYFNPFEFLHWGFGLTTTIVFVVTLLVSLFLFRPFCYLLCPLGLITWLLEHVSLIRVKVDRNTCTDCDICVEESPCPSVRAILDKKLSRPDCHACGKCIEVCPEGSLSFKI